jgi:hypothetical protein
MKHLLTAIACCLAIAGSAQNTYNHDSDGDGCITVIDVLSVLSQFDTCEEVPSDLMYWIHLGAGTWPYAQNLMGEGPFYYEATEGATSESSFEPIFEDMMANPTDWTVFVPSDSQAGLTSGDSFNFPTGIGTNFYYFLIPDSYGIPDLTVTQSLSAGGCGPNDVAAEKMAIDLNGISYTMYRVNGAASTNALYITYN